MEQSQEHGEHNKDLSFLHMAPELKYHILGINYKFHHYCSNIIVLVPLKSQLKACASWTKILIRLEVAASPQFGVNLWVSVKHLQTVLLRNRRCTNKAELNWNRMHC